MDFASRYLSDCYKPKITAPLSDMLCGAVVIPCYLEQNIFDTLLSLLACYQTEKIIEVIIVVNYPEYVSEEVKELNRAIFLQLIEFSNNHSTDKLHFLPFWIGEVKKKLAGAGFARKAGMDEAIYRFKQINKPENFIISLDADTTVSDGYLRDIEFAFRNKNIRQIIIPFEHPLENLPLAEREAIVLYELYLRYYRLSLKHIGWAWAFHTIGSAFAVRASVYVEQSGMSHRNAGEDFYFLNKLFPLGGTEVLESVCVYPASRLSHRVPFGTGPAMKQIIDNNHVLLVYTFQSFLDLQYFTSSASFLYNREANAIEQYIKKAPSALSTFWIETDFEKLIYECNIKCTNLSSFTKRLYCKFDAFQIVKYLNFTHQRFYNKNHIEIEFQQLLKRMNVDVKNNNRDSLLQIARYIDRLS